MFIDTHCHLTDEYLSLDDLDGIVARAQSVGVKTLICSCAQVSDFTKALEITDKYNNIFCTLGIHPEYAHIKDKNVFPLPLPNNEKVIGIGEIGLDYHYGAENKKQQIELFKNQIEIARNAKLPVAIHTRDAEEDTAMILDGSVTGVMHCFTGTWEFAKKMLDHGFYFSSSGIITFKNADELRDVFSKIPIDRIVVETDSPWCAPAPYRGKKCEPAMVIETARVLADIKNLQLADLEIILEQNTKQLYPKIKLN